MFDMIIAGLALLVSVINVVLYFRLQGKYNEMTKTQMLTAQGAVETQVRNSISDANKEVLHYATEVEKNPSSKVTQKAYFTAEEKPTYQEIEDLNPSRTWEYIVVNGNTHEIDRMPTAVSDVGYEVSLKESICELRDFDDQVLFPYIEKLITTIEYILQPSKMIDY